MVGPLTLGRRVAALEDTWSDGGGGCDKCLGTMLVVRDAVTGEFCSAEFNGQEITEEEVRERETRLRCPHCGSRIDPDVTSEIQIGGPPLREYGAL